MNIIARAAAAAVVSVLCLLLSSCGGNGVPEGAVVLDGVYKAENIAMPQTDHMLGSPAISGGETYLIEWSDDGDYLLTGSGERYPLDGFSTSHIFPDGGEVAFYGMDDGMSDIYGVMKEGKLLWSIPVTDYMKSPLKNKMSGDIGTLFMMKAKDLWYIIGEKDIVIADDKGSVIKHITTDGSVVTAFEHKDKVSVITVNSHLILSGTDESDGPPWNGIIGKYSIVGGTDKDTALARQGDTLIKVNTADLSEELLINFNNSGVKGSGIISFVYESDDLLWCLSRLPGSGHEACRLTRLGQRIFDRDRVVNLVYFENRPVYDTAAYLFNKNQDDYFVQLKPYTGDSFDEYDRYVDLTVIGGGDCDLLELRGDTGKYISKGLFADLYAGVVSREDIFSPVRKLYERGGALPVIPLSFGIWGMQSDGTLTDGGDGWTPERFMEICESGAPVQDLRSGNAVFHLYGFDEAMYTSFVGESFDREAFLEYTRFLSLEMTEGDDGQDPPLRFLNMFGRRSWIDTMLIGGKKGYSIIGNPTSHGGRFKVCGYEELAVLKDSPSSEGAKAFLRYLLTGEYLSEGGMTTAIPSTKGCAEKSWEWELSYTAGYAVSRGRERIFDVTYEMLDENGDLKEMYTDLTDYTPNDEKLFDEYISFLESVEPMEPIPTAVLDIINEELSAVEGGRSAGEIADILEKRINLYLQENK